MENIVTTVVEFVKLVSSPIVQCWRYHGGLKENLKKLDERLEDLNCQNRSIRSRLEVEYVSGRTILNQEVERWLKKVEKIIDGRIGMIKQRAQNVRFFSRVLLGKEVIQTMEEVQQLYREGRTLPIDLVIPLPQQTGEILLTTTLGVETTPEKKIEEIWSCLMDGEDRKIGVYGMGGIGKTTVLKHINNRILQEEKAKFDDVIWVTVSKASSVFNLQNAIAREMNLDISKSGDETRRAGKLNAELTRKGRYVLILDDLWDVYRLEEVGIPEPTAENGCKLVLTTRLLSVCLGMSCKPIQLELLSDTESLDLFLDTVGRDVLLEPNLEETVKYVAKECARLPLAIVTIAGSLKGIDDSNVWKAALEDLRESTKGTNGIFDKLKFSYDRLNDENLQNCLLYCALYPEDYEIEIDLLIEYLIAEEIVKGKTRQTELERGRAMLKKLVNACLLEYTTSICGQEFVKMHDLIRDMAIQITRDSSPRFLVEAGVGLKFIPDEENWKEDLEKVSLMHNNILDIPSSFEPPNCPRLSTLLLCSNHQLSSISNNFFVHMKGLSLLDLSKTSIENLPESITNLVSLTTLLLRKCKKLKYVSSFAELTALKKLDFCESGIKKVPEGMEKLVKLRFLDLDGCKLEIIPDGILCELSNLQSLALNLECGTKIRGEELIHMRKLEILYGILYDLKSFNAYVRSLKAGGPTYYILQLGFTEGTRWSAVRKWSKVVYLVNFSISESVATSRECPLMLPKDVEILAIKKCHVNVRSLCELTSFINATNLKWCYIKYCGGIEYLLSYSSTIFGLLQTLEVLDLEAVWDLRELLGTEKGLPSVPLPPNTFSSLRKVRIGLCKYIRRLFINDAPFPNLEELIVFECDQLVEIISTTSDYHKEGEGILDDDIVVVNIALPKLLKLHLIALPELESIPIIADSLEQIIVRECPKLERIPPLDREPRPPSLQCVYIGQELWESLEWDHPNAKNAIEAMRVQ